MGKTLGGRVTGRVAKVKVMNLIKFIIQQKQDEWRKITIIFYLGSERSLSRKKEKEREQWLMWH
jgi:hypothetical protein